MRIKQLKATLSNSPQHKPFHTNTLSHQQISQISPKFIENSLFKTPSTNTRLNYEKMIKSGHSKNIITSLSINQIKTRFSEIVSDQANPRSQSQSIAKINLHNRNRKNATMVITRNISLREAKRKSEEKVKEFMESEEPGHSTLYYRMMETVSKNNPATYHYSSSLQTQKQTFTTPTKSLRQGCNPYSPSAIKQKNSPKNSLSNLSFLKKQAINLQKNTSQLIPCTDQSYDKFQQFKVNKKYKKGKQFMRTQPIDRMLSDEKNFRSSSTSNNNVWRSRKTFVFGQNSFCYNNALHERPTKFWKQSVTTKSESTPNKKILIVREQVSRKSERFRKNIIEHRNSVEDGVQPWQKDNEYEMMQIQINDHFPH